jgi:TolC family type I secretion outer membrane protein
LDPPRLTKELLVINNLQKKQAVFLFIFLAAFTFLGPAAALPEEGNGRLTLQRAIDIGLKEHPTLKETKERVDAARYGIGISRSAYFPQVRFEYNYYYGDAFARSSQGNVAISTPSQVASPISPTQEALSFWIYRFSANQLLYDFGKTPGKVAQSRASFEQTREDYVDNRQLVVLDVRSSYFGYLAAQRAVKVTEETVRQNQELVKQAQGFYDVGLRAKIDVTKAEANLYTAEADLIRAKNTAELAKVTLMTALGMKTFPFVGLEDVLEITPIPQSLAELKEVALKRRPDMVKNRYQQDSDKAALTVARAGYFPTLSSTAAYGWQGNDYPLPSNWWIGAAVTFPLFEGLATKYSVSQARSNMQATLANTEVLRQNITKEVDQRYLDLTAAWELIRATKKALEAARENFRLAQGRYQVGVGSIIEVTDAQVQYFQADLRFVRALYDYRVAEAQLDKAIGKPF